MQLSNTSQLQEFRGSRESLYISHLWQMADWAREIRQDVLGIVGNADDPLAQGPEELSALALKFKNEEPLQKNMVSGEQLLETGEAVGTNYHTMMEYIAHQVGAQFIPGPIKTLERIHQKAQQKYVHQGGYNAIRDVLRGSLIFKNLEDLYRALEEIHGTVKIVQIEDSFVSPKESGYMDLKLILEFEGPNGEPFLAEAQLHLGHFGPAQKKERELYRTRRRSEEQLNTLATDDPRRAALETLIKNRRNQAKKGYEQAARTYNLKDRRKGI